jgi:hypothetical protein
MTISRLPLNTVYIVVEPCASPEWNEMILNSPIIKIPDKYYVVPYFDDFHESRGMASLEKVT